MILGNPDLAKNTDLARNNPDSVKDNPNSVEYRILTFFTKNPCDVVTSKKKSEG